MLILKNLSKQYQEHRAVHNVSIEVPKGELWGFLGVNGAGKSTTMKMIAGLLKPTAGEIYIDGVNVLKQATQAKKIIGYVPDRPYLYERLTAVEYMYFVGKLYQIPTDEIEAKVHLWLQEFELLDKQHHYIESFSHAMKQRLVMASVFLHEPQLFIVDEPMVGLDPRSARRLKALLKKQ